MLLALFCGSLLFVFSIQAAGPKPEVRVARLDQLVTLTPEQKINAAEIFRVEDAALEALPANDRPLSGADARQKSRQQIRSLLTPAQRNKFDLAPQSLGGGLRVNPDFMVERLEQLLTLSADQKQRAREILWNELADQLAAVPEGSELPGFRWKDETQDKIRALLTPAQLQKYNATPVSQGGAAKMTGILPKAK